MQAAVTAPDARMNRRRFLVAGAAAPLATVAGAAVEARPDRTLRVAFQTPETGFDPAQVQDAYSNRIIVHIFDAPLRFDFMARPARLVPNTTVGLPVVSSDFRTFTLRIRPGIPARSATTPPCTRNCRSSARRAPRRCSTCSDTSTATTTGGGSSPTDRRWCWKWPRRRRSSTVDRTSTGSAAWMRSA